MRRILFALLILLLTGCLPAPPAAPTGSLPPVMPPASGFSAVALQLPWNPDMALLAGGVRDGVWLDDASAAMLLSGGEIWTLYPSRRTVTGALPEAGLPTGGYFVPFTASPGAVDQIAMSDGRPAMPREPLELVPTDDHRALVARWLTTVSDSMPVVVITAVWQVDLEGDASNELLISATRFSEPSGHDVDARDHSVILLVRAGADEPIEVIGDYYAEPVSNAFPVTYTLAGALDLDGDGDLEVLVRVTRWEGIGLLAFEIIGDTAREVLRAVSFE